MPSLISAGTSTNTAVSITGDTSGALAFATNNGTTAVTIDTSQNVGIGTASPTTKLHVVGRLNVVGSIGTISTDSQGLTLDLNRAGTTGITNNNASGVLTFGTATNEVMRIDSVGNVGIGITPSVWSTTNSTKALQISSRGSIWANVNSTSINNNWYLASGDVNRYINTAPATRYVQDATGIHQWFYAASGSADATISFTEAMRIDTSGNLLVGTTSWSSGSNGISIGANSNSRILITNSTDFGLEIYGATTNRIGFAASNSGTRVGSITVNTTNTAYNTSSDYRLKENIAPMTGALAKVSLLKPCTYTWKVDGSDGQGFIAHELQEVMDGCVTGEKDAVDADGNPVYQGIDTSFLVATLTAAIQELKAIVDTQATEIAALKTQVGA
jgi:hypothetical protein